jgi:hypothetical protein
MDNRIKRSLEVLRNLPRYLEASRARSHDHSIPLDSARNRCLKQIEVIQGTNSRHKVKALEEAWQIYLDLQDFKAPSGERQDYNPRREISLNSLPENSLWVDGRGSPDDTSSEVHSGGLGFKHVNWDSAYLIGKAKRNPVGGYWRKENDKTFPVKIYTRKELERFFLPCR